MEYLSDKEDNKALVAYLERQDFVFAVGQEIISGIARYNEFFILENSKTFNHHHLALPQSVVIMGLCCYGVPNVDRTLFCSLDMSDDWDLSIVWHIKSYASRELTIDLADPTMWETCQRQCRAVCDKASLEKRRWYRRQPLKPTLTIIKHDQGLAKIEPNRFTVQLEHRHANREYSHLS